MDWLENLRVSNPYLQISPKTRTLYLWTKRGTRFLFELQVEYQSRKIRLWRISISKSLCSPILGPHILSCQFKRYHQNDESLFGVYPFKKGKRAYDTYNTSTFLKTSYKLERRSCWISTSGYFYVNTQLEGLES